jgi:uncharacterized protein (TIGR03435 family)
MRPIAFLLLLTCAVGAQDTAAPSFEVASVKVAAPPPAMGPGMGPVRIMRGCGKPDPAMVRCTNTPLKQLIVRAYGVKNYQVEGPGWIDSDGFDVMAKVPEGVPADKVPAMLQAMLAERFGLKIHKETRTLPAFELTVAKSGPKLKETDVAKLPGFPEPGSNAPPPPPPPRGPGNGPPALSNMPAGAIMMMMSPTGARMLRGNMTMDQLVNSLTSSLSRPVFDKTDLKATYEIELSYLGDENDSVGRMMASLPPPPDGGGAGRGGDGAHQADANVPTATLAQALQALGLKLEAKKLPIDMIVVDGANKVPTEN